MNEVAKKQVNNLQKIVNDRKLYCQVREINTGLLNSPISGMYMMIGLDESAINSYGKLDVSGFVDEYNKQAIKTGIIFPKCQIVKITDSNNLEAAADVLDLAIELEFLRDKLKDFNFKKMPTEIEDSLVVLATEYYDEAINMERPEEVRKAAWGGVEMIFNFLNSGCKSVEEFVSKNKKYKTGDDPNFRYETGIDWKSDSPNHVDIEHLFMPTRTVASTPIQEKYLKEFEKMMEQNGIMFHIDPEPVIYNNFGEVDHPDQKKIFKDAPQVLIYHRVEYDSVYSNLINGWANAMHFDELKKHAKKLVFENGSKYIGISVPIYWLKLVTENLKDNGANYIFDINGTYAASTKGLFGIVVDNETDLRKVYKAIEGAIKAKSEYKVIDRTAEIKALGKGDGRIGEQSQSIFTKLGIEER